MNDWLFVFVASFVPACIVAFMVGVVRVLVVR